MWRFLRTILFFLTFTLAFSQDPETFFTTGEAQLSSGDLAGAESSFNAALKADPSFAPAYQGLSKLYLHRGDLKKANEYSIQAVQADEDFRDWATQISKITEHVQNGNRNVHLGLH